VKALIGVGSQPSNARLLLLFSGAAFTLGCGDEGGLQPTDDSTASAPDARAPSALLRLGQSVRLLAATPSTRLAPGTRHFMPIADAQSVSVRVNDYVNEEGRIALTGSVEGTEDTSFLLKSKGDELFGWVVLRDRNLAYLYQSVNGALEVREVPVERIVPVCNLKGKSEAKPPADTAEPVLSAPSGGEPWIGSYGNQDLSKLQSRPGASKVLYLNISAAMNGDTPKDFSKEEMWKAWASVAAGYSAFDVNVTTDSSVYAAAGVTNSGLADVFSGNETAVCVVGAFGTRTACLLYTGPDAEPEKGYGLGRTALHELGHAMGLSHDGTSSEEYAPALREFDWAPIMGNYYTHSGAEALNQWSKGEYSGANEKEDDLAIIARDLPFRPDDVSGSKPLSLNGTSVAASANRGQIASNTDSDTFTFSITQSGGHATLDVSRIEYYGGSMLDVDARLTNSSGSELAANNPKAARGAKLDLDLPVGNYNLVIKGGAEGTAANGFSNYSSLGYYAIQGTITGAGAMGGGGSGGTGGVGPGGAGGSSGGAGGRGLGGAGGRPGGAGGVGLGGSTSGGGSGGNISGGSSSGGSGGNASAGAAGNGSNSAGAGNGSGGTANAGSPSGGASGAGVSQGGTTSLGGAGANTAGSAANAGSSFAGSSPAGPSPKPSADDDGGCSCDVVGGTRQGRAPAPLWLAGVAAAIFGMRRRRL
jgi:hypothetical protein